MYFISVSPEIGQCPGVNKMVDTLGKGSGKVCAVLFSCHKKALTSLGLTH